MLTVHDFSYGLLTPGLAYLMSVVGSFLGLRCTSRSRVSSGSSRLRWLLVGAGSIGITGIWVMHFIAMLGFTIPGEVIHYNVPVTLASMLISVAFVSIGLLIVGLPETMKVKSLLFGGIVTGLGVGAMHYSGMAAMRMAGRMSYSPGLFALSILIAVVAATAALWFALRLHGFWSGFGAALIMGVAVSGMHYTGMAAMHVYAPDGSTMPMAGADASAFLLPLIVGVSVTTFVLTAAIALSPTAAEITEEAELMRKIQGLHAQPQGFATPASRARDDDNPNFRPTLRQLADDRR
jgi:NO-binding membrane sensor protein with MHYT domain